MQAHGHLERAGSVLVGFHEAVLRRRVDAVDEEPDARHTAACLCHIGTVGTIDMAIRLSAVFDGDFVVEETLVDKVNVVDRAEVVPEQGARLDGSNT